ncbi:Phosphatidylinositol 3-kinase, nodule isoform [Smittium mucronatum]|nr:Phosphatidylinositol 3-kinase, nodule isoform [Smittium mucronatum]
MSEKERNLIWEFRYFLKSNPNALGKFVQSVDWSEPHESTPAFELLNQWSEIGVEQALELLIPEINQGSSMIWSFAISILSRSEDSILLLYLLQLVQAIKFEPSIHSKLSKKHQNHDSKINKPRISSKTPKNPSGESSPIGQLAALLISRSINDFDFCVRFYWFLMVESDSPRYNKLYGHVAYNLMSGMDKTENGRIYRQTLRRQSELVYKLSNLASDISKSKEPRTKKIENLRSFLSDKLNGLDEFPPLAHPLDPGKLVVGIVPERAMVFKSAMSPLLLVFKVIDGSEFTIIYKHGDDMRQDQLVLQIIDVMNNLFLKENLDLKLTCYKVISTGINQGMSEFIPSSSLSSVLAENSNSISNYLKICWTNPNRAPGVSESVIMGVGDRHLDNLLLTNTGKLFHVDYGYILGHDPKPFPPPIKLCKEMVEAMNLSTKNVQPILSGYEVNSTVYNPSFQTSSPDGRSTPSAQTVFQKQQQLQLVNSSKLYDQFKSNCFVSYSLLRKTENSKLVLSLFSLMSKSELPDISEEPDQATTFIESRLRMDLNDEMATQSFQNTINDSISALFPQVMETIHKWAQYWRN